MLSAFRGLAGLHTTQSCDKKGASLSMSRTVQLLLASNFLFSALFFGGCETLPQGIQEAKIEMAQRIVTEE